MLSNVQKMQHTDLFQDPLDTGGAARPEDRKVKNILIISSAFSPHVFGGAEIAAYNRAKLLAKRGHNVSIVTLLEKNVQPSWGEMSPEGFRRYHIKSPRQYTLFERPHIKPLLNKIIWHLQDYFDERNRRLINAVLDDALPDYVEIDNLIGIGFNALSEIGKRDIPVAYMLHDLNLACFNTGMIRNGKSCQQQCISCRCVGRLRQSCLNDIRRLGFVSPSRANLERARKFIPAIDRSLSCVISNVPEEVPPLPKKVITDHVRLLFVGRLDPVKGIDFLMQTLDRLSKSHKFHLTILGTGPSEQRLKGKYGRVSWVTFCGFVPKMQVAAALAESDLCCIPSLVQESYGLVTAQALQLGTPVIGSDAGGTSELVRDGTTGMLLPPGDRKAWHDAFLKIFSNPAVLATWHENAVSHAKEFNEDIIGQSLEDFMDKLSLCPIWGH
jgi:glycosyltransferase involved in cell wall biosynthesis